VRGGQRACHIAKDGGSLTERNWSALETVAQ